MSKERENVVLGDTLKKCDVKGNQLKNGSAKGNSIVPNEAER